MDTPRVETTPQISSKERVLLDYANKAEGAFLRAAVPNDAQERLFEWVYYTRASDEVFRSGTSAANPLHTVVAHDAVERGRRIMAAINQTGDWTEAKKSLEIDLDDVRLTHEDADRLGLPDDLEVDGVVIFGQRVNPYNAVEPDPKRRLDVFNKLVESQLDLVPDKTEKWQHPRMAELTRQVAG